MCQYRLVIFSVGGEYSISHRKSRYMTLPVGIVNNENSRIRENMTSAFIDYSRAFGRVSLQAGLRYEHIHFVYYDNGERMDAQCKDYGNWFPSFALSWPVGKAISLVNIYRNRPIFLFQ